jgi:hypothetical protein
MLASTTTFNVVVPLIVGLLGGVFGGTLTRVMSRNDVRREKYADALSALRELQSLPPQHPARVEAEAKVADQANWLELDSLPVGDAFKELWAKTAAGDGGGSRDAREKFVAAARAYSRWTLYERPLLHLKAKRDRRRG